MINSLWFKRDGNAVWICIENIYACLHMKILFLSAFYPPDIGGGAEITLKNLVDCFYNYGHNVVVLSIGSEKGIHIDNVDGVKVYRAGIRNIYFHLQQIKRSAINRFFWHLLDIYNPFMNDYIHEVIDEEKPDLVSCHNVTGWSIAAWDAIADHDIPIVQVLHDLYLICVRSTMFTDSGQCENQCALCRMMRLPHATRSVRLDAVVGISNFMLERFANYGYFRQVPFREVIYNTRYFPRNVLPDSARQDDGKVVFGFIGTLASSKGIERLLQAFTKSARSNWRLRIAGTGRKDYTEKLFSKWKDPRITFLGYTSQEDFFPAIDLCVVPSLWNEPLGMVVPESFMFGVPVLGSKRGGIPEMIVEGVNGQLFDPDISGDLESALIDMAGKVSEWRRDRSAIVNSASMFADIRGWVQRWESLYSRVCSNRR